MSVQVREIVLYRADGRMRRLQFRLGKVNVITGRSGTGKSAIIPILDYCLGRSTFLIPEGVIRESIAWYAVVLHIRVGLQLFIAKPAPIGSATSQSKVMLRSAAVVEPPAFDELIADSNDAAVESLLTRELGITPNINTPETGQSRNPLEANLSHTKFLLFQEQGLVANRDLLFFRQSEPFIPQAIKDTLPYFLGAVEENHLALIEELRALRREMKLLERDLSEREAITGGGVTTARGLMLEAMQAGLMPAGEIPATQYELRRSLSGVERWTPTAAPDNAAQDAQRVREDIRILRAQQRELAEAEGEARAFSQHAGSYSEEVAEQAARLESINLISTHHDAATCPFCGTKSEVLAPPASKLSERLNSLNEQLEAVSQQKPRLVEHLSSITIRQADLRQRIRERQNDLASLEREDARFEAIADQNSRIARIVGRVSLYLESAPSSDDVQLLKHQLTVKRNRANEIDSLLSKDAEADVLSSILNRIGLDMTALASTLLFEHREYPLRFDLKNLTVVSDRPMRPFPMQRMGSGQNWLVCHLVAHLALHKHFRENSRPVPGFLVLDQPSQVYFPSDDIYKKSDGSIEQTESAVEDITAVESLFRVLFDFVAEQNGEFQIIVFEHANLRSDEYQRSLVEDRWDGVHNALVPPAWQSQPD